MVNYLYYGNYINNKEKFIVDINKCEKELLINMGNLIVIFYVKLNVVN